MESICLVKKFCQARQRQQDTENNIYKADFARFPQPTHQFILMIIPLFLDQVFLPSFFRQMCVHVQSCWTLCDPVDCSLPGSSVHAILQARILERVAISSSGDLRNQEAPRQMAVGHGFFLRVFSLCCFELEIIHLPQRRFEVANFAFPTLLSLILFVNPRQPSSN